MSATRARCECCGVQLTMGDADTRCTVCEETRVVWRRPSRGLLARLSAFLRRLAGQECRAVGR